MRRDVNLKVGLRLVLLEAVAAAEVNGFGVVELLMPRQLLRVFEDFHAVRLRTEQLLVASVIFLVSLQKPQGLVNLLAERTFVEQHRLLSRALRHLSSRNGVLELVVMIQAGLELEPLGADVAIEWTLEVRPLMLYEHVARLKRMAAAGAMKVPLLRVNSKVVTMKFILCGELCVADVAFKAFDAMMDLILVSF